MSDRTRSTDSTAAACRVAGLDLLMDLAEGVLGLLADLVRFRDAGAAAGASSE